METMERLFGLDAQLLHDALFLGVAVLVLFILLSYLLFNPARDFLKKRQEKIKGELDFASKEKTDAIAMKAEYDGKMKAAEKDAEVILSEARRKALQKEAEIIAEAKEEAARIIARANVEIALEKKKALEDVKQEMISIAALMAEKAVAGKMDVTVQDALVNDALSEIGESTWQS